MSEEKTYTQAEVAKLLRQAERKGAKSKDAISLKERAKIAMEGTHLTDVKVAEKLVSFGVLQEHMKHFSDHHGNLSRKQVWEFLRECVAYKPRK